MLIGINIFLNNYFQMLLIICVEFISLFILNDILGNSYTQFFNFIIDYVRKLFYLL
jgi:hypothetical protein